jgi:hypothetical protein
MSVTHQDLTDFTRYAQQQLSGSGADSVEQLAREWAEARQLADDIAESEADIAAGRVHSAEEVFTDIRQKLGLPE